MKSSLVKKVKIFLDGADRSSMLENANNPLVKGFTTNPTLMRKAGVTDYAAFCKDILSHIKEKPISFEVFADDFKEMKEQALKIATWGQNVYVKIPITNSEGASSIPLIHDLSHQGVKLNVTALFNLRQVWETCKAVQGGAPTIVSVFSGRIADTGSDPVPMMQASVALCEETGPQVELLWASPREALNIVQADQIGCHIITVTQDLVNKVSLFGKDLNEYSLETVKMFRRDALAAGYTL